MFGTIHKFDKYSITFLVNGCATAKLHRVLNRKFKTHKFETGKRVFYEVSDNDTKRLPTLEFIEEAEFDHCPDCWEARPVTETQPICYCTVGRDLVSETFKVVDCKEKFYEHDTGLKLTMELENAPDHKYYAVFFADGPYTNVADGLEPGDMVKVRAELKSSGNGHSLLSVFYIEKIFNDLE